MRLILTFSAILSALCLNAQITITSADMPEVNHSYYSEIIDDFSSIDVAVTGASQTWDFSTVTSIGQDTLYAAPVSSTPFAYQFYFNNVFLYPDYAADYAVPAADIGATGVSLSERFEYFKSDGSGQKIVGFGANVQGVPASVPYDTIDYIYDFPMDYTNSGSSNAEYLLSVPTFGAYGQWITRSKTVDGWGTVITPAGSYDCLRVQTILEQTDTIYVDMFGFGFMTPRPTDTIYDWIAQGEGIPVFTATVGAAGIQSARYKSGEINSISENAALNVKLFPNPATDLIILETDEAGILSLYDISGKLMLTKQYAAMEQIDLSEINSGFYQLLLKSNSGKSISRKIEIIK